MPCRHVCFVPLFENDKALFVRLYRDYLKQLSQYNAELTDTTISEIAEFTTRCLNKELPYSIDLIYNAGDEKPIGFIISSENVFRSSSFFSYFIDEFYIIPEYQSKGFGRAAVEKYICNINQGPIGLYIYCKNGRAISFWTRTFSDLGYPLDSRPADDEEFVPGEALLLSTLIK